MSDSTLARLAGHFALMSLFAIGGANSALPEMQRVAVELEHWMTARQFTDVFALAQVAPGPNVIIVTLIGYQAAGLMGALVATLAMCGPSCLFAFYVGRISERLKGAHWSAIQQGLLPISIGLIAASGFVVATAAAQRRGGPGHLGDGASLFHDAIESALDFRRGRTHGTRRFALIATSRSLPVAHWDVLWIASCAPDWEVRGA